MKKLYLFALLITWSACSYAQTLAVLQNKLDKATTPVEKIRGLNGIAKYYILDGNNDSLAKACIAKEIAIADKTGDQTLITKTYLMAGSTWLSFLGANDIERLSMANSFLQTALINARKNKQTTLEADVYLQFASYNKMPRVNRLDTAMAFVNKTKAILKENPNDSLMVIAVRSAAGIYLMQGDQLNAFRNYSAGLTIAEKTENPALLSDMYISMGAFYTSLEDYDKSLEYLLKCFKLMDENHLIKDEQSINIYMRIGQSYVGKKDYNTARKYFTEMRERAIKLHLHEIMVNQPLFYIEATYMEEKNYKALVQYIQNPQLVKLINQYNQAYLLNWYWGAYYEQQGKADSAAHYYDQVLEPASRLAQPATLISIYIAYGFFKIQTGQNAVGLQWMEKAREAGIKANSLAMNALIYQSLDSAYAKTGNKAKAYDYRVLYDEYTAKLKDQNKARQITLAEVNAEGQRLKLKQEKEEEALRKKHNLQYMGITAAIATVFIVLLLTGMFTTSAQIIRGIGFFAFIFFFEFVTLLCDHVIHDWTHGEPLKIMAIKIVFVALLVPVHHYVEEKVIHHLIHRKKIKLNKYLSGRGKSQEALTPELA